MKLLSGFFLFLALTLVNTDHASALEHSLQEAEQALAILEFEALTKQLFGPALKLCNFECKDGTGETRSIPTTVDCTQYCIEFCSYPQFPEYSSECKERNGRPLLGQSQSAVD